MALSKSSLSGSEDVPVPTWDRVAFFFRQPVNATQAARASSKMRWGLDMLNGSTFPKLLVETPRLIPCNSDLHRPAGSNSLDQRFIRLVHHRANRFRRAGSMKNRRSRHQNLRSRTDDLGYIFRADSPVHFNSEIVMAPFPRFPELAYFRQ